MKRKKRKRANFSFSKHFVSKTRFVKEELIKKLVTNSVADRFQPDVSMSDETLADLGVDSLEAA